MTESVDWTLAAATANRLAPRGPSLPAVETREAVAMLRDLAAQAVEPVRRVTGLHADELDAARVVDRRAWIDSNLRGLRIAMAPLLEEMTESPFRSIGAKGTAVQVGAVLAWLSGKVLGQYEVFTDPGEPGRLLLVAPTIVQVERTLQVDERDFRLWVCLHEETHRVQFGAVPWLGDHLLTLVGEFIEASDLGLRDMVRSIAAAAQAIARPGGVSVMEAVQSPEQRRILRRMTGLMSLLEGHADVVMDEVGPEVIPSVAQIRERFEQRRSSPSAIDNVARRAFGMDMKLRQYREGAVFVRAVIDAVGVDGFNRVWSSPQSLPSHAEILDPSMWLIRMALQPAAVG